MAAPAVRDSCLVCVRGRDTTRSLASLQSFAVSHEGLSSFSASGVCLPRSGDDGDAQQMLIPLSLVAPFLNPTHSQVGGECSQVGEGFRRRV